MRLIDADALLRDLNNRNTPFNAKINEAIIFAPTVDLYKHGRWINKGFEPIRCSVCGITVDAINGIPWAIKSFNYCPHCGAKMDEGKE